MTDNAYCFAVEAKKLIRLGFHPLPINATNKLPAEYIGGTWHGLPIWQKYRDRKIEWGECEHMSGWPEVNIGLVLGSRVGQHAIIAIDIDARETRSVEDIVSCLPFSPMAKVGAKGVTLFFRGDVNLKSTNYARETEQSREMLCEILTGNRARQTVVPPSTHPDGMTYRWLRGPTAAIELPILEMDDVSVLEETLQNLGWKPHGNNGVAGHRAKRVIERPHAKSDSPFNELNSGALQNLELWVPQLGLYKLQSKQGSFGYKAVATWRESSTGKPVHIRKTNLHITPMGIRDFGADVGYTPIDLVMSAMSVNFDSAYAWLSERVYGEFVSSAGILKSSPRMEASDGI